MKKPLVISLILFFATAGNSQMVFDHIGTHTRFGFYPYYSFISKDKFKIDREIPLLNRTLYCKISNVQTHEISEFFDLDSSEFHCINYFSNGQKQSEGNYKVEWKNIISVDSMVTQNINTGGWTLEIYKCPKIEKSGDWIEYDDSLSSFYMNGNYSNGKRTGEWYHHVASWDEKKIDYSSDSTKLIYTDNNIRNSLSQKEWNDKLSGRWVTYSGFSIKECRYLILYKCSKNQTCSDKNASYLEFKADNSMIINEWDSSKKQYSKYIGTYSFKKIGDAENISLNLPDSNFNFAILYLNQYDNLLIKKTK